MQIKSFSIIGLSLVATLLSTTNFAATSGTKEHFSCPLPSEIQSSDLTVPAIWTARPMSNSKQGQVGVGLGGKIPKELLGVESTVINHRPGWVCVYKSEGGLSVNEYQNKILDTVASNQFLRNRLEDVKKMFRDAEPYLKDYPTNTSVGFIGYQTYTPDNDDYEPKLK